MKDVVKRIVSPEMERGVRESAISPEMARGVRESARAKGKPSIGTWSESERGWGGNE